MWATKIAVICKKSNCNVRRKKLTSTLQKRHDSESNKANQYSLVFSPEGIKTGELSSSATKMMLADALTTNLSKIRSTNSATSILLWDSWFDQRGEIVDRGSPDRLVLKQAHAGWKHKALNKSLQARSDREACINSRIILWNLFSITTHVSSRKRTLGVILKNQLDCGIGPQDSFWNGTSVLKWWWDLLRENQKRLLVVHCTFSVGYLREVPYPEDAALVYPLYLVLKKLCCTLNNLTVSKMSRLKHDEPPFSFVSNSSYSEENHRTRVKIETYSVFILVIHAVRFSSSLRTT